MDMEFTTNRANLGSEHSFRHEVQNPNNNSKRVLLPLERTSVICPIPVLSSSRLTTTGDRTTDKLHRLPSLVIFPGGTSLERNISPKRGEDVDRLLHPPSSDSRKRSRKSNRSKHSHKKRRRSISSSPSSSPSDNQSHDYGRYKESRHSPQAAEIPSMLQPAEITNVPTISQPEHTLQRPTKDSVSDSETETWSFDMAINEVFRLLPPELCPRPSEEHTPAKPLLGIEHLMESHATPLLVLPQSKLVENTVRFLQSKTGTEKCGRD